MNIIIKKIESHWVVLICREDGSINDYRFASKAAAQKWVREHC